MMPSKSPSKTRRPPQDIRNSPRIGAKKDHTVRETQNINFSGSESDSDSENYEENHTAASEFPKIEGEGHIIKNVRCRKCSKKQLFQFTIPGKIPESADAKIHLKCNHCKEIWRLKRVGNEYCLEEHENQSMEKPGSIESYIQTYYIGPIILVLIVAYIFSIYLGNTVEPQTPTTLTIDSIKLKFPNQDTKLWKAVASGLNDTINDNYPTSYMFLHQDGAEKTTENLLKELSEYAVCQLTKCNNTPIYFNEVLDSYETDYGSILTQYKPALKNSGVMIVENLDQVPEKFALAFHSFCDGISPLVAKSAFFFTMKVDEFGTSPLMDVRYVEKRLKEKWSGIKDDQSGPLLTRITAMLLRVYPEEEKLDK